MKQNEKVEKAARALLSMQRHSWEQGVAMQAFLEMDRKETVIAMAYEAVYRQTEDGRAATIGVTDAITDPCSVGEALKNACEWTSDAFLIQGKERLLEWALRKAPRNKNGVLYHLTTSEQFWVDSTYMLPPFLAANGYFSEALLNFYGYVDALYDEKAKLMCHMWDNKAQKYTREAHWGTGNGWTLAAIARMVPMLRESGRMQDAERLIRLAQELLASLLRYFREDGLFTDVVDEPDTFVETNLSQMAAYTIYRGIKDGWLSMDYKKYADRMRLAANQKMNPYGFIQGVCGAPTFNKAGYSPEGQAFYLLMESAAKKLEQ